MSRLTLNLRKKCWFKSFFIAVLFIVFFHSGYVSSQTNSADDAQAPFKKSSIHIDSRNELVSLRVQDMALSDVLEVISQECEIVVHLYSVFNDRVTFNIEDVSLPEVITRLLRTYNFALHYIRPDAHFETISPKRNSRLWVYSNNESNEGSGQSNVDPASMVRVIHPVLVEGTTNDNESDLLTLNLDLFAEDRYTRLDAIDTLADMDDSDAVATLAFALGDQDASVREQTVDALAAHGDAMSVQVLEQAINDLDTTVRHTAIGSLGEIGTKDSVRALGSALYHQDPTTREEAVYALAHIDDTSAAQLIEQSLKDAEISVRLAAIESLVNLNNDISTTAALEVVIDDRSPIVREEVVHALGEIGDQDAFKLLQQATNDKNNAIAALARETLNSFSN